MQDPTEGRRLQALAEGTRALEDKLAPLTSDATDKGLRRAKDLAEDLSAAPFSSEKATSSGIGAINPNCVQFIASPINPARIVARSAAGA